MKLAGLVPRIVPGCFIQHAESASLKAMSDDQKKLFGMHFQRNFALYRQKWGGVVGKEAWTEPSL